MLVTSNFSFSHSVFKRLVSQGRQKVSLCWNGLSQVQIKHIFRRKEFLWIKNLSLNCFRDRTLLVMGKTLLPFVFNSAFNGVILSVVNSVVYYRVVFTRFSSYVFTILNNRQNMGYLKSDINLLPCDVIFKLPWERSRPKIGKGARIFSFSHNVFYLIRENGIIWATLKVSSENAFNK